MGHALRVVHEDVQGKKNYINEVNTQPKFGVKFADFVAQTVERKERRMRESYKSNYGTLIYHINKFSELNDCEIFTNSVNEYFLDDFIVYLQGEGLRMNYISHVISMLKSMIKKAAVYGYAVDSTYDDVSVDREEGFAVYLTMNEITRIYYFKGLTKKQERIRDLFVVGCLTALRYSDYSTLTKDNFVDGYINKVTQKTNKRVLIPLHDYVKEIYAKYDGEISKGLSIQHFNRYIKGICARVGINESISYSYTKGDKLVSETKPKSELISSHTARRSAATNMYLSGLKTFDIMTLTGHSTESSFFRYIRVTKDESAKSLKNNNFFKK